MTLERAEELLKVQVDFGGGYNRNACRLILAEIQTEHGQSGVDTLINLLELEKHFGYKAGTKFSI